MEKSAAEIRLDYTNAMRQADALADAAGELKGIARNNMEDCILEISGSWKGENASAYASKCRGLKDNVLESARKLEETASAIRSIARNTYNAEMAALRPAQERKY